MTNNLEAWMFAFGEIPLNKRIAFISGIIMFASAIYVSVISPIIFNYIIIPGIEKKIGKQLDLHPLLSYIFLGEWMCRQNEIAIYLINRYLAMRFKNDRGLPKYCLRFGLRKAGYTIDMSTKFEIIMSFLLVMVFIIIIISATIALYASDQLPFFSHSQNFV